MARRMAKIAAISCSHSPLLPKEHKSWVLNTLSSIKGLTHFGHLGDVFESSCASVHPNEDTHTLEDEFSCAASFLSDIREVVGPECIRWINTGNHDDNLIAADPRRIPRALRGLTNWNRHPVYGQEFRRWAWLPYEKSSRAIMRVGQVHFWHGFDAGHSSDELEGLQMISLEGWIPHALAVRGHTHRPVPPTQAKRTAKIPLPYWYSNVGTVGPTKPGYMKRKDSSQWGAAIIVVECLWDRPSKLNGKCWEAQLIRIEDAHNTG